MEAAAIVGFTSAIGAYGGFFIPKAFGDSLTLTGRPEVALLVFFVFYLSCLAVNWLFYVRRGSVLHPASMPTQIEAAQ